MIPARLFFIALLFLTFTYRSFGSEKADNVFDALVKGEADLNLRYRLENVDQANFSKNATASTLLTQLSYETATFQGFSGFLEVTHTAVIGKETYNDTINGNINRPVIADPETTELNQAYLNYKASWGSVRFGRQAFALDNQRFFGTASFRQNNRTLDAASLMLTPIEGLTATYGYIWNVNQPQGDDHPFGNLDTNTHAINVAYEGWGPGKLTFYGYLIDMNDMGRIGLSSATFGMRYAGTSPITDTISLTYQAEYARQQDYKDNPFDYKADYIHLGATATKSGFSIGLDYEVLGSDNSVGFQTPFAALHGPNGWADRFLSATPEAGLRDLSASVAYEFPSEHRLNGLLLKTVYHHFKADTGGATHGTEWDFLISKPISKHFSAQVKAAFYNADSHAVDTDKIWFILTANF